MFTLSFATIIHNQVDTLQMAVESILPLVSKYNSEFIFVNNGSTDGSDILMQRLEKKWNLNVKYFDLPFGQVPLWEGRLFTFKRCSNDWIILLDGDHIFEDNFFDVISKKLKVLRPVTYLLRLKRTCGFHDGAPLYGGVQSFHPIIYRNSKDWIEGTRIAKRGIVHTVLGPRVCNIPIDLPKSKTNKLIKIEETYLFNIGSSIKLRALRKYWWWYWQKLDKRHKKISLDDYIREKTNCDDLNLAAEKHWKEWILDNTRAWDEEKDGLLPTPIKKRIGKRWNQKTLSWEKIEA